MKILVDPEFISVGESVFANPPSLDNLRGVLGADHFREVRKGSPYLPIAVFDDLGIVVRFKPETGNVVLLDVFFATSRNESEPKHSFDSILVLDGQELKRPVLLKNLDLKGAFSFDGKPVPASRGRRISVSLVPKFEYVGTVNIGWNVEE